MPGCLIYKRRKGFSMIEIMIALVILSVTLISGARIQLWTQQKSQLLIETEKLQWLVNGLKSLMLEHKDRFTAVECSPKKLTYQPLQTFCFKKVVGSAFPLACTTSPPNLPELAVGACCSASASDGEATVCWLGLRWWQQQKQASQQWLYSVVH